MSGSLSEYHESWHDSLFARWPASTNLEDNCHIPYVLCTAFCGFWTKKENRLYSN